MPVKLQKPLSIDLRVHYFPENQHQHIHMLTRYEGCGGGCPNGLRKTGVGGVGFEIVVDVFGRGIVTPKVASGLVIHRTNQ